MESPLQKISRIITFTFCPLFIFFIWLVDLVQHIIYMYTSYGDSWLREANLTLLFAVFYLIVFFSFIIYIAGIFKREKIDERLLKISSRILFFDLALLFTFIFLWNKVDFVDTNTAPLLALVVLILFVTSILLSLINKVKYRIGGKSLVLGILFLLAFLFLCFKFVIAALSI